MARNSTHGADNNFTKDDKASNFFSERGINSSQNKKSAHQISNVNNMRPLSSKIKTADGQTNNQQFDYKNDNVLKQDKVNTS